MYDPHNQFSLIKEINTKFITDWHTLTYLSVENQGEHLAVVSENGYLFVWNVFDEKFVFSSKIHNGSIESLCWRGNMMLCSSSDCTFSQITVNYCDESNRELPKI